MITESAAEAIIKRLESSSKSGREFREEAMRALSTLNGYSWCGVYRLEGEELMLDAFVGEETEHTRIPVGVGVCGTAVATDTNQVIEDVRELENYLACSLKTRSEIVVLVKKDKRTVGQIDIDGHETGAFSAADERFLEEVGSLLSARW